MSWRRQFAKNRRELPAARFYVTRGAAVRLRSRRVADIARQESVSDEQVEAALVDLALEKNRRLLDLTTDDVAFSEVARTTLSKRGEPLADLAARVREALIRKIENGSHAHENTRFLHTEPHHDDLMLGYLPNIVRNVRSASNVHHFVTLTSGFTAVTNQYMLQQIGYLRRFLNRPECAALYSGGYFDQDNREGRNRDIWQYLDGLAANKPPVGWSSSKRGTSKSSATPLAAYARPPRPRHSLTHTRPCQRRAAA